MRVLIDHDENTIIFHCERISNAKLN